MEGLMTSPSEQDVAVTAAAQAAGQAAGMARKGGGAAGDPMGGTETLAAPYPMQQPYIPPEPGPDEGQGGVT
jgi:hypothetical protein